jgi:hypothetical protein
MRKRLLSLAASSTVGLGILAAGVGSTTALAAQHKPHTNPECVALVGNIVCDVDVLNNNNVWIPVTITVTKNTLDLSLIEVNVNKVLDNITVGQVASQNDVDVIAANIVTSLKNVNIACGLVNVQAGAFQSIKNC